MSISTQDEQLTLTRAEAVALIKRQPAGTRFGVHARGDAPSANDPDKCFPYALNVVVSISREACMKVARDCLTTGAEERGARVPVHIMVMTFGSGRASRSLYIL